MKLSLRTLAPILFVLPAACSSPSDSTSAPSDLTGTTSEERPISFQATVYVPPGTADSDISNAIAAEIKTALGALRDQQVAFEDRGAESNLDPSKWTRALRDVVDPKTKATTGQVLEVTYPYSDKAVVTKALDGQSTVSFVMLAGYYGDHATQLIANCSDDTTTDVGSLWYHFQPSLGTCQTLIQNENTAIQNEKSALESLPWDLGPTEASRWFYPVTAKLGPANLPPHDFYPEYDRLFGLNDSSRTELVVYAFNGVDTNENDPDDILGQEAVRFLRTMLKGQPNFRVTSTNPFAMLLDFYVNGTKLSNVTYDEAFGWVLDNAGYPAEVGTDAGLIANLRAQVMQKLAERWIYWDLPITVNGKSLTVEVRFFYGDEDSSPTAIQHAQWRYLEAFWYGDVFLYNGHSHFGNGPLEPNLYGPQNFNDRYQIMLVNSCLSYNYYHQDFFKMKPGGTANLEILVNGSPSYVWGGGEATADMLLALLSGSPQSYASILGDMRIDLPWGVSQYDPDRVVDGELDNVYTPTATPISLTVRAPLY